ncbi:MAG: ferritin [Saprospiraceae bacterium]|jgi:ferritin|nr:ferritin [Saprospiraceae bacterium]
MISKTMESALNKQIELEAYASFLYLSMASWCDKEGLNGCAAFMHRQSDEERQHMLKIYHYISEVNGHGLTPAIAQPPHEFESINKMFEQVYLHEQKVTKSIHSLVELSNKEDDYTTLNFLQWYITEQREEEALMRSILDKIKLIGTGPMSLYYIDNEIQKINKAEMTAEEVEKEA